MEKGILYIVATPIGNLGDISFRAVEILKKVDLIAAEDTRHASILLNHYGIHTKRISYYDEIEESRSNELVEKLLQGLNLALISDAGTPSLSDPGYRLITKALLKEIPVVPIPGASSILAALTASGLAMDRFAYEGFLPRKKGRQTRLRELALEPRTIVIFESPYRVLKTLKDLIENLGDRPAVAARELTKMFEEFRRGKLSDILRHFNEHAPKGEFVILVEGNKKTK